MADNLIAPPPDAKAMPTAPPPSAPPQAAAPANIPAADSAEMDKLFGPIDAPEAPPAAPNPAPKGEPAPNAPRDASGKFAAAPPSSPKPEPKATPKPAAAPQGGPKELREELERTRSEAKTNLEQRTALEAKVKEYEAKHKDTDALMARLSALEKERDELAAERRALKQEASPEFKQKYEEPFKRAAKYAERVVNGLQTAEGQPANFDRDFAPLYSLPYNAAIAKARETFGDDAAPLVMQQVAELQRLDYQKQEAFEEEKKGWADRAKAEEGRQVQEREQAKAMWEKTNQDLREKVEEYRDTPDDKEAVEARQKGYAAFDYVPKTGREYYLQEAHKRHSFALSRVQKLQISRLRAENEKLKAELAGATEAIPNADGRKAGGVDAPTEKSWEDEFNATVARA